MTTVVAEPIVTDRLDLLPLQVSHAPEMAVVLDDPALHTFIGGAPETEEELRARYERIIAGSSEPGVSWLTWVVRMREESSLTGYVQATVSASSEGPTSEIAWVVGTSWQGRGIAKEAVVALVDWLAWLPVRSTIAHIHPDHHASAAVATAAGLTPTDEWQDGEVRYRRTFPA